MQGYFESNFRKEAKVMEVYRYETILNVRNLARDYGRNVMKFAEYT